MLTPHYHIDENKDQIRWQDFHFLNIDLELVSSHDLRPLLKELAGYTSVLFHHGFKDNFDHTTLEILKLDIYESFNDKNDLVGGADKLISAFVL